MTLRNSFFAVFVFAVWAVVTAPTVGAERHISLRSAYLATPLEGFRQVSLTGTLDKGAGSGHIELNPNECGLNPFGDTTICTKMAVTNRTVTFHLAKIEDESGLKRQLWGISGTPLKHSLALIVPEQLEGPYRLIHTMRDGSRRVITMEPLVYYQDAKKPVERVAKEKPHCADLPHKVNGIVAEAVVRPGFVNDTYFLFLRGLKPNLNTFVELQPVVYTMQPDFWRIDVKECQSGDIVLPTVSPYSLDEEITSVMGKKGIELHWANGEVQQIERP